MAALSPPSHAAGRQEPVASVHPAADRDAIDARFDLVGRSAASRGGDRTHMLWPASGAITGPFGEQRGHGRHPGMDIDGSTGDPVTAAADGVVVIAGPAPSGYSGYGTIIVIDVGDGMETVYAHLSRVLVHTGDTVRAGDHIGAIGTSGHVTGSHLHFEVRINGVVTNPAAFLSRR